MENENQKANQKDIPEQSGKMPESNMEKGVVDITKEKVHNLKIRSLLKLSVRAFRVRPTRTILTVLGMSVGIGTVFFLISLGYGLQFILLGKLAPTADSLVSLEASYPEQGSFSIPQSTIDVIAKMPDVAEVSPVSNIAGEIQCQEFIGDVMVKIIDDKYNRLSGQVSNFVLPNSNFDSGAVISSTALRVLGLPEDASSLGKMITLKVVYQDDNVIVKAGDGAKQETNQTKNSIPIVGIITDTARAPYVFIPQNLMTKNPSSYDLFYVKANSDKALEKLRADLIAQGFMISARIDTVQQAKRITDIITFVLGVFGVAALIVSSIGMFNTMLISFMERIFEVGIMKSIGATKSDILRMFLMESLLMGILGGIGGILLGFSLGTLVNFGMNVLAHYLGGKPLSLFIYSTQFMLFIIALSGTVGLVSGFFPARKAAKLSAREAFLRK
jgi:ABC-type antimicrobial peptide transport system permease subunit